MLSAGCGSDTGYSLLVVDCAAYRDWRTTSRHRQFGVELDFRRTFDGETRIPVCKGPVEWSGSSRRWAPGLKPFSVWRRAMSQHVVRPSDSGGLHLTAVPLRTSSLESSLHSHSLVSAVHRVKSRDR